MRYLALVIALMLGMGIGGGAVYAMTIQSEVFAQKEADTWESIEECIEALRPIYREVSVESGVILLSPPYDIRNGCRTMMAVKRYPGRVQEAIMWSSIGRSLVKHR